MGGPWTPESDGKWDGIKYVDRAGQMKALLGAQCPTEKQIIDFIFSATEEQAKCEIQPLDQQNRKTADEKYLIF